jgi:hypothetical protein
MRPRSSAVCTSSSSGAGTNAPVWHVDEQLVQRPKHGREVTVGQQTQRDAAPARVPATRQCRMPRASSRSACCGRVRRGRRPDRRRTDHPTGSLGRSFQRSPRAAYRAFLVFMGAPDRITGARRFWSCDEVRRHVRPTPRPGRAAAVARRRPAALGRRRDQQNRVIPGDGAQDTRRVRCDASIVDARWLAAPGGVRNTTRLPDASAVTSNSSNNRRSRDGTCSTARRGGAGDGIHKAAASAHLDRAERFQIARERRLGDLDARVGEQREQLALRAHRAVGEQPRDLGPTGGRRCGDHGGSPASATSSRPGKAATNVSSSWASMTSGGANRSASGATALTMNPASRAERHHLCRNRFG